MKTFNITGMTCEHCAISIEKALNKINGIQKASVSLVNNRAIIDTDKSITDKDIIDVVKKVGYGASMITNKTSEKNMHVETTAQ